MNQHNTKKQTNLFDLEIQFEIRDHSDYPKSQKRMTEGRGAKICYGNGSFNHCEVMLGSFSSGLIIFSKDLHSDFL